MVHDRRIEREKKDTLELEVLLAEILKKRNVIKTDTLKVQNVH